MPPPLFPGPLAALPPPAAIRQMLCIRAAEVALLRRLLRVSESRERMLPPALVAGVSAHTPAGPPEGVAGE